MSLLTHGGRIVPILADQEHQHPNSTPEAEAGVIDKTPPCAANSSFCLNEQHPDLLAMTRRKSPSCLEMPSLKDHGLFAWETVGDGNCLYYSLSDQLYGTFKHANEIRQILASHIASNKGYFMQFVAAQGGERRRPKRATTSAYTTRSPDVLTPSEMDMERQFDAMVSKSSTNGEWGSSEHLQAFCQVFKLDVNVYTTAGVQPFRDVYAAHGEQRESINVAFHDYKHYSSVRPVAGHHTGILAKSNCLEPHSVSVKKDGGNSINVSLPATLSAKPAVSELNPNTITVTDNTRSTKTLSPSSSFTSNSSSDSQSTSNSSSDTQPTSNSSIPTDAAELAVAVVSPWDIQSIQEGLGGRYDRETIVNVLQKCRGDIDRAFAALLGEQSESDKKVIPAPPLKPSVQASRSSSPYSTGSKRSADDSDDSEDPRPAVRRGRPRKRLVSNLTLGISIRGDQNEVVSLNLQMDEDAEKAAAEKARTEGDSPHSQKSSSLTRGPRRSGRLSKSRPA